MSIVEIIHEVIMCGFCTSKTVRTVVNLPSENSSGANKLHLSPVDRCCISVHFLNCSRCERWSSWQHPFVRFGMRWDKQRLNLCTSSVGLQPSWLCLIRWWYRLSNPRGIGVSLKRVTTCASVRALHLALGAGGGYILFVEAALVHTHQPRPWWI